MKSRTAALLGLGGLALATTVVALKVSASPPPPPPPPNVALSSVQWRRPVQATLYAFGGLTVNDTVENAATAIASLNPTYVEGLVRVEGTTGNPDGQLPLAAQVIADFETVRSTVLAVNPGALFSMRLRTTQYPTSADLVGDIQSLLSQVQPDVIFFDTMDDIVIGGTDVTAEYQAAAVQTCHSLGVKAQFDVASKGVLGPVTTPPDVYSCSDWPSVPGGGPVSIVDVGFMLGPFMSQLQSLSNGTGRPLLLHANNSATPVDQYGNPERAQFANESLPAGQVMTTAQREGFYTDGAQDQAGNGFALEYGVIGPTITVGPPSVDFYAPSDGSMMQTLQALSTQYNSPPSSS